MRILSIERWVIIASAASLKIEFISPHNAENRDWVSYIIYDEP